MQPKKNEKVDLTKNSSLYFVIGLSFILLISWQAIEWKTYKKTYGYEALNVEDDDDEEIPITEQIKTPPPPPTVPRRIEWAHNEWTMAVPRSVRRALAKTS